MTDSCLLCAGRNLKLLRKYRTKSTEGAVLFGHAAIAECAECRLIQVVNPPPAEELQAYYRQDYRKDGYGGANVADLAKFPYDNLYYYNRGKSICELLRGFVKHRADRPLHILDVGAGYGHTLYFMGKQFPDASLHAIEFSDPCVKQLQSQHISVSMLPIEQVLCETTITYDVVILSHVLEHLIDPKNILGLIRSRLARNGILYVEVPNIPCESILQYPDHVWAPRHDEPHITFFSENVLGMLMTRSGFEPQFSSTCGPLYRYISKFRYTLPPFRTTVEGLMPRAFFQFLRRLEVTQGIRVKEREDSFFQYGGTDRIWIRSIWNPSD